jgi:hypothetical protein
MNSPRGKAPWQWLVRTQTAEGWKSVIVPGGDNQTAIKLSDGSEPKSVMVSAVSRLGREGKPARAQISKRN